MTRRFQICVFACIILTLVAARSIQINSDSLSLPDIVLEDVPIAPEKFKFDYYELTKHTGLFYEESDVEFFAKLSELSASLENVTCPITPCESCVKVVPKYQTVVRYEYEIKPVLVLTCPRLANVFHSNYRNITIINKKKNKNPSNKSKLNKKMKAFADLIVQSLFE